MSVLYDKGHHIHADNGYTSENLFVHLERNETVPWGTAMGNGPRISSSLKTGPLEKAKHSFRGNQYMLMVRYKDKKDIFFSW